MEEKAKTVELEGTKYVPHVGKHALIEKWNEDNILSLHDMHFTGTHYEGWYDRINKRLAAGPLLADVGSFVRVPQMKELDPTTMAFVYRLPIATLHARNDFEILVDPEFLARRRAGELPRVFIEEDLYLVDLARQRITSQTDSTKFIPLADMGLSEDGESKTFFYDREQKAPYEIDWKMLRLPDHVFLVSIALEKVMDPYGARPREADERDFLMRYRPQWTYDSFLTPAVDTFLQGLVDRNRVNYNKGKGSAVDGPVSRRL